MNTQRRGRRKFPRRSLKRSVGVLHHGDYEIRDGYAVGEGGMSFMSTTLVPVADEIVVSFKVPGGSLTSIRAEVRNHITKEKGRVVHGLRFINLDIETRRKIRAYVASRPGSEAPA